MTSAPTLRPRRKTRLTARPFFHWSWIGLAAIAVTAGVYTGFHLAGTWPWESTAGRIVLAGLGLALMLLGGRGLYRTADSDYGVGRIIGVYICLAVLLAGFEGLYSAAVASPFATTLAGMVLALALAMAIAFGIIVAGVRWVLGLKLTVFAVAREVIDEALRMRLAIVFMIATALLIAALPFMVGGGEKLTYRIQQFMAYSLIVTSLLLSVMTILVACATLSGEIRDKQIFTVMTKPIARGTYLLGKWLGIVLLDGVLLTVATGAIYVFVTGYLVYQPVMDPDDRAAIHTQVLTARIAAKPTPPDELAQRVDERIQALIDNQGELYIEERGGEEEMRKEIAEQEITEWLSLGPLGSQRNMTQLIFENLGQAKKMGPYVQLQFKLCASRNPPNSETEIGWVVNGRPLERRQIVLNTVITQQIETWRIDDEGRLVVIPVNLNPNTSVNFPQKDGLELLYTVDTFTPNYIRGVAIMWMKLAFIAALGLAAATFLGFPVAVLVSLLVFVGATGSQYMLESANYYGRGEDATMVTAVIKVINTAIATPLRAWGEYRTITPLVDGRYIGWGAVAWCAIWIGGVWTGLAGLIGWLVFRRRELARVQV